MALVWLLASVPVLLVLVLMMLFRWPAARAGLLGLLAAMLIAAGCFGAGFAVQRTAVARGVLMAMDVLPIVWGAYLFYRVTDEAGAIAALGQALPALTPSRGLQALIIGWAFASFLQGVGGFGVPVAVTAPILAGLGFAPLAAVVIPSIGHAWAVTFGSLASAFQAMVSATDLPPSMLAPASAAALGVVGLSCGLVVAQMASGWRGVARLTVPIVCIGAAMGVTHYLLATHGLWSLASVGAGLAGLAVGVAIIWLGAGSAGRLPAGTLERLAYGLKGYVLLVAVICLVRLVLPLQAALQRWTVEIVLPATATEQGFLVPAVVQRYTPWGHTGTLLLCACLLAFLLYAGRGGAHGLISLRRVAGGTLRPMIPVTLGILSMVALAAVMEYAGMIRALAQGLAAAAGPGFAVVSPWIGALGAYVTGSNISSNLVLSALQARTAGLLGLEAARVLALQNVGGALGSVLSPTKVIVAVSTVGLTGQEGRVMRPLAIALGAILLLVSLVEGIGLLIAVVQSA